MALIPIEKTVPIKFFHREASRSEFVKMFLAESYTVENCQRSTLGYPNLYRSVSPIIL